MSAISTREYFQQSMQLLRSATADVANSPKYLSEILKRFTLMEREFSENPRITRFVCPQYLESVTIAATTGVITPTSDIPIVFPRKGRVHGVSAEIIEGTAVGLSRVSMSLKVNGDINMVVQGNAEGYCPLAFLARTENKFFPINMPVSTVDKWFVKFTSELPYNPEGATLLRYTPKLMFWFEEEGI